MSATFIPAPGTTPKRPPLRTLEDRAVAEIRILAAHELDKTPGARTVLHIDAAGLEADTVLVFPPCSILEFRNAEVIQTRLEAATARLREFIPPLWRFFLRIHFFSLTGNEVSRLVAAMAVQPQLSETRTAQELGVLPALVRHRVALAWLGLQVQHKDIEGQTWELGRPLDEVVAWYRELWRRRRGEQEARERLVQFALERLPKTPSPHASAESAELYRLLLSDPSGPYSQMLQQIGKLRDIQEPIRTELRRLEAAVDAEVHRLDLVVDEGSAVWGESASVDDPEIEPIIPMESGTAPASRYKSLSASNPYRRGLELCLTIEKKFGRHYVRLATSAASIPLRMLSELLSPSQLSQIDESSPWHPTVRLQRIASAREDELKKIQGGIDKAMEVFALLDAELPPVAVYAWNKWHATEG